MKTLNFFLLASLMFVVLGADAQVSQHVDYFLKNLKGEECQLPDTKNIKLRHIERHREAIWKAWKVANEQLEEEKLIPLEDINKGKSGQFNIPSNLEPNAVMPYYYGSKGKPDNNTYSFFLYIHGSGPKANEWANGLYFAKTFEDAPAIYFVPQIPNEGVYYRWYQKSKQYVWNKLLRQVLTDDRINPNQLYLFGISEGGYGSQRLASFYADYLAGAGPMAGGEPLKNAPAENCRNIAFSLRTGANDYGFYRDILTGYTKAAFDSLQQLHPEDFQHNIELIPGKGHSIDYRPTTPWLKAYTRNPWPKSFSWEDFEMDGIHRNGFYNLEILQRPDSILRTRYDVNICENKIDISISNVHYQTTETDQRWGIEMKFHRTYSPASGGSLRLYLNEHLVDLSKPVSVSINGKEIYKKKVQLNESNMLNSLTTFADPMRIYPAAITLKY